MVFYETADNWTNKVLKNLPRYEHKFIVHTDTEILFESADMLEANKWRIAYQTANGLGDVMSLYFVPRHFDSVRIRMLKVRSILTGQWEPMYPVLFSLDDGASLNLNMLVDSGADISFISKNIGEQLGLKKAAHETVETAFGVGSRLSYLNRTLNVKIDDTELSVRFLWSQDEGVDDIILGRLDVFDRFDVLFSQKKRKVIFLPNDDGDATAVELQL
jgi:gag-polyprotein putative aspartyl protease